MLGLASSEGLAGSLIVGPHAEYAYDLLFGKDFIPQPIVDVDSPGVGACKVTYKLFE